MQGTILQLLFLVSHGNLALSYRGSTDIYPNETAFKFTESVKFVDIQGDGNELQQIPFAENPNEWLSRLKSEKCSGLRAVRLSTDNKTMSDRMSVAFVGGGGRWLIEAVFPHGSDYWEAKWEIGNREHPQKKIWRVTYARVALNQAVTPVQASVNEVALSFESTLNSALAFCARHELHGFAKSFEAALSALKMQTEPDLDDLAQKGQLPLEAARLIVAAQMAWVFGGMGSWNDIGFEGEEELAYQTISADLFKLINDALCSAINTSFPKRRSGWWQFWK